MKMIKTLFLGGCLLFASNGTAQEYDEFDVNNDDFIDRNEFNDAYADYFDEWDENDDGVVENEEFYNTTYDRMDTNNDYELSENEWDLGYEYMYGDYINTTDYRDVNKDNDDRVSGPEFFQSFNDIDDNSFYNSYDQDMDESIDSDELNSSVFNNWDRDRNGLLDRREYATYRDNFLD